MDEAAPASRIVRFGDFELDLEAGQLRREGARVKLQDQPLRVLALLLERPGELVTRDELRTRLWPADTFVDFDLGLNTAVRKLRQALDDSAERPRFVETVPKRGYRFIGAMDRAQPPLLAPMEPSARRRSRWRAGAALLLAALLAGGGWALYLKPRRPAPGRAPRTLAVLPFHVLGESGLRSELGLGIADGVIARLARAGDLRVRPTSAILSYDGRSIDPREAGRELKASLVLSGAVRRRDPGFRVAVELTGVAAGNEGSIWKTSFDLEAQELVQLEDRIAAQVAAALDVALGQTMGLASPRHYPRSVAAYEAYLLGRARLVRYTRESTAASVESFEEAVRLDPDYALAHAGLAVASAEMHLRFAPPAEVEAWAAKAKSAAERAQSLDPRLAETHEALAAVYGKTDFEWDLTIRESRRALELNPRLELPYSYLGRAYYHLGLLERGETQARMALVLDPENRTEPLRTQAVAVLLSGRAAEAVPLLEEVQRLSRRHSDSWLALALFYGGERARAEALLQELSRSSSASAAARGRATLASVLAARGESAAAADLVRTVSAGDYMDHHVAYGLGAALAQLGRPREAVDWLRRAVQSGFPCHPWYASDPLLRPLHGQPGFETLLEELRRSREAAAARYPEP